MPCLPPVAAQCPSVPGSGQQSVRGSARAPTHSVSPQDPRDPACRGNVAKIHLSNVMRIHSWIWKAGHLDRVGQSTFPELSAPVGAARSTIPRPTSSKNAATCVHENVRPAEGNRCWPPVASSVEAVEVSPAAPRYHSGSASQARLPEASLGPTLQAGAPTDSSLSSCSQRHSGLCPGSGPAAWWDTEEPCGATRPRSPP